MRKFEIFTEKEPAIYENSDQARTYQPKFTITMNMAVGVTEEGYNYENTNRKHDTLLEVS